MAVPDFGVTSSDVQAHFFPSIETFGASTVPTSTAVTTMVQASAAELLGKLSAQEVDGEAIDTDNGATYPAAFAWCADTVRLGAAVRVGRAILGDTEVLKSWKEELKARFDTLAALGFDALGDAPEPSDGDAISPRTHISEHDLDTGDETDVSDLVPRFRRSDVL